MMAFITSTPRGSDRSPQGWPLWLAIVLFYGLLGLLVAGEVFADAILDSSTSTCCPGMEKSRMARQ